MFLHVPIMARVSFQVAVVPASGSFPFGAQRLQGEAAFSTGELMRVLRYDTPSQLIIIYRIL